MKIDEDINIQDIEELKIKDRFIKTGIGAFKVSITDIEFSNKINDLIKAVKKLDKEINRYG